MSHTRKNAAPTDPATGRAVEQEAQKVTDAPPQESFTTHLVIAAGIAVVIALFIGPPFGVVDGLSTQPIRTYVGLGLFLVAFICIVLAALNTDEQK